MIKRYNIPLVSMLVSAVALVLGMFSCVIDAGANRVGEQQVQITVAAASTRAGEEVGDPEDSAISKMSVGGYSTHDGTKNFFEEVDFDDDDDDGGTGTVNVLTGKHDMYFIANINPSPMPDNVYELRRYPVPMSEFCAGKDIPMLKEMKGVMITALSDVPDPQHGDRVPGKADDPEIDPDSNPFEVTVTRLGIRLDITLTLDDVRFEEWFGDTPEITFDNVPEQVYLIQGLDNHAVGTVSIPVDTELETTVDGAKKTTTITIPRIILPELWLTGTNNKEANGLKMTIKAKSWTKGISGVIKPTEKIGEGYSIPRNTRLFINATARDQDFDFNVELEEWTGRSIKHDL
jgi:hypothetical protein